MNLSFKYQLEETKCLTDDRTCLSRKLCSVTVRIWIIYKSLKESGLNRLLVIEITELHLQ